MHEAVIQSSICGIVKIRADIVGPAVLRTTDLRFSQYIPKAGNLGDLLSVPNRHACASSSASEAL